MSRRYCRRPSRTLPIALASKACLCIISNIDARQPQPQKIRHQMSDSIRVASDTFRATNRGSVRTSGRESSQCRPSVHSLDGPPTGAVRGTVRRCGREIGGPQRIEGFAIWRPWTGLIAYFYITESPTQIRAAPSRPAHTPKAAPSVVPLF